MHMLMKWFSALTESIAPVAEAVTETVAAVETPAPAANALVGLPLFTKGLLTTVMGLLGVFLVLTLFFLMIKIMQKTGSKASK